MTRPKSNLRATSGGTLFAFQLAVALRARIVQADSHDLLERFIRVGTQLESRSGDAGSVAARTVATRALLDPAHPTRRRCDLGLFVVDDGEHQGRVAAIVNPRVVDEHGRPIGLLGLFACDDDVDTAHGLLGDAGAWLAKRGCRVFRGPINFSTWHDYRFVVDSWADEWIPGEPRHPDYYPQLWRDAGFRIAATYSTNWLGDPGEILARFADRAETCVANGYVVRPAGPADLPAVYTISSTAFASAWMYSGIEPDEFAALYSPGRASSAASSSYLVFSPAHQPVGFLYAFPTVLASRRASVCKTVAVVPAHQDRLPYHLLMHTWLRDQVATGCEHFVGALMHCGGTPALMGWIRPETRIKEYEVYERAI